MTQAEGCSDAALDDAADALDATFPVALRTAYRHADGWYLGEGHGEWHLIWPLARLLTQNLGDWTSGDLPRHLVAFGDDGSGAPFCVARSGTSEEVLRWSPISEETDGTWPDVEAFMAEWCHPG